MTIFCIHVKRQSNFNDSGRLRASFSGDFPYGLPPGRFEPLTESVGHDSSFVFTDQKRSGLLMTDDRTWGMQWQCSSSVMQAC
jgi:hypothetical protein